jgi:hypothetical protein
MDKDVEKVKVQKVGVKGVKFVIGAEEWKRFRLLVLGNGDTVSKVVGRLILLYVEKKGKVT